MEAEEAWKQTKEKIREAVGDHCYTMWFQSCTAVRKNGVLQIRAPNNLAAEFIADNFGEMLADMGVVLCET